MTELPTLARARWLKEPGLKAVFRAIAGAGGEARVAGGAVRNALLGEKLADIDLATTLQPGAVTAACDAAGMKVVPTGLDHGTVTVVSGGRPFEVTTLRRDVETDGRRAKVKFTDNWQADALRRSGSSVCPSESYSAVPRPSAVRPAPNRHAAGPRNLRLPTLNILESPIMN